MKTCKKCLKELAIINFNSYNYSKDKKAYVCRLCASKAMAKLRYKNSESILGHLKGLLGQIKYRSKQKKLEIDITLDTLIELYAKQSGLCALSKVKLTHIAGKGRILTNVSIDRIDATKGYTIDNVQLVCDIINTMKQKLTQEEFISWCALIINNSNYKAE